jgi:hypothetical protein
VAARAVVLNGLRLANALPRQAVNILLKIPCDETRVTRHPPHETAGATPPEAPAQFPFSRLR